MVARAWRSGGPTPLSRSLRIGCLLRPGALAVVFQPIVEILAGGRRLLALEGLVRPPGSAGFRSVCDLFEHARAAGDESLLDEAAAAAILLETAGLPLQPDISLNVHASTLAAGREFVDHIEEISWTHSLSLSRLVVEILEHSAARDGSTFQRTLRELRSRGVRIALDDVGAGSSNYGMILDAAPDYLKIDRYIVANCHRDRRRCAIIESIVVLASRLGARVIAEGVEHPPELSMVRSLGIDLIQGFILAPPLVPSGLGRALQAVLGHPFGGPPAPTSPEGRPAVPPQGTLS